MRDQFADDLPPDILDQAIYWMVQYKSGGFNKLISREHQKWLESNPMNKKAWLRLQAVEGEFDQVANDKRKSAYNILEKNYANDQRVSIKLLSLIVCSLILSLIFSYTPQAKIILADYNTSVGEVQVINLNSDASIHLSSHSAIDVKETLQGVKIHLHKGQILIDSSAASTLDKPEVITKYANFQPIGTKFVITKNKDSVTLDVIEGQVQVDHAMQSLKNIASAGEHWRIAENESQKLPSSGIKPGTWPEYLIEVDNARLQDVLNEIDRYRYGWIKYDKEVAELRVSGVFRLDDTDAALNAIAASLPVNINYNSQWWINITKNN